MTPQDAAIGRVMVYGATGFSGRAIAARLIQSGVDTILAGRSRPRLEALGRELRAPTIAFEAGCADTITPHLQGIAVLLNAAGPFPATAPTLIEACLRTGVHYLDLAGEWPVFDLAMSRSASAEAAGVMLMPGAGFTIAMSDALMLTAVRAVPDVVRLRVAFDLPQVVSRGTLRTFVGLASDRAIVRRGGALASEPFGRLRRHFNFGRGEVPCVAGSSADVVTGQKTTGVGDIETYLAAPLLFQAGCRIAAAASQVLGETTVRQALAPLADLWPDHPTAEAQSHAVNTIVVETVDPWRRTRRFGLRTIDSYTVTTRAACVIIRNVLAGDVRPGFQTPAGLYGPGLLDEVGCAWSFDASAVAPSAASAAVGAAGTTAA